LHTYSAFLAEKQLLKQKHYDDAWFWLSAFGISALPAAGDRGERKKIGESFIPFKTGAGAMLYKQLTVFTGLVLCCLKLLLMLCSSFSC